MAAVPPPAAAPATPKLEKCQEGARISVGQFKFLCQGLLGRGSFSEVYSATLMSGKNGSEAAIKDITCRSQHELQQALFEAHLLCSLNNGSPSRRSAAEVSRPLKIPLYLSHQVDQSNACEWHVRMAMTKVPGEALDAFLKRASPDRLPAQDRLRSGLALAAQLVVQIGPTLDQVSEHAWHRDVNSHNILISDESTQSSGGGTLDRSGDLENLASKASFWLIDFGLAVEVKTWPTSWQTADIGGDCRYWPPSSWLMSFYGAEAMKGKADLCRQYETRLDIYGLAVTALELLCIEVVGVDRQADVEELGEEWQELLQAWGSFWSDVSRWHAQVYEVFSRGGDITSLYTRLAKERVVDTVLEHLTAVRRCLRACAKDVETAHGHRELLCVLAEMLDEGSQVTLQDMVLAVDPKSVVSSKAAEKSVSAPPGPALAPPPPLKKPNGHSLQAPPPMPSFVPLTIPVPVSQQQQKPALPSPTPSLVLPVQQQVSSPAGAAPLPVFGVPPTRQPSPAGSRWATPQPNRVLQGLTSASSSAPQGQWRAALGAGLPSPATSSGLQPAAAAAQNCRGRSPVHTHSSPSCFAREVTSTTWRPAPASYTPQLFPRAAGVPRAASPSPPGPAGACVSSFVPMPATPGTATGLRPAVTRAVSVQPAARRPDPAAAAAAARASGTQTPQSRSYTVCPTAPGVQQPPPPGALMRPVTSPCVAHHPPTAHRAASPAATHVLSTPRGPAEDKSKVVANRTHLGRAKLAGA